MTFWLYDLWILTSYVLSFSLGAGPVPALLLPEIFASRIRAKAVSLALGTHWVSDFTMKCRIFHVINPFIVSNQTRFVFPVLNRSPTSSSASLSWVLWTSSVSARCTWDSQLYVFWLFCTLPVTLWKQKAARWRQ